MIMHMTMKHPKAEVVQWPGFANTFDEVADKILAETRSVVQWLKKQGAEYKVQDGVLKIIDKDRDVWRSVIPNDYLMCREPGVIEIASKLYLDEMWEADKVVPPMPDEEFKEALRNKTLSEKALGHGDDKRPRTNVLQPWVEELPFMQQSVLIAGIRGPDGIAKKHPAKHIIRMYRRAVLLSAFDARALESPWEPGGGSFTGPLPDRMSVAEAQNMFIDARDEMTLHYYGHAMHAFQIVGAKSPNDTYKQVFNELYVRMAHAMHLWPETEDQLNERLGDRIDGWKAREDSSTNCSD